MFERLHHPRPQMARKHWRSLNGVWDFAFDDANLGIQNHNFLKPGFFDREIVVPYSYQTKNSRLHTLENHPIVWYRKTITVSKKEGRRFLLHFDAVDYQADIWIDGNHVFTHQGGHVPFQIDIMPYLQTEDVSIVVRAEDHNRCSQPIGKQSWKDANFLCWYTRTTGIWQQVWLEEVADTYIAEVRMTPDIDNATMEFDFFVAGSEIPARVEGNITYQGRPVTSFRVAVKNNRARIIADVSSEDANFRLHFWSCAEPNLYDVRFTLVSETGAIDEADSYFGMRDIRQEGHRVFLNNQEFVQRLVLDQGYFADGGLSATPEQLRDDLLKVREMGFNGTRKHQKVEDARYMYLCDVLGLVMWAEMPSFFEYSPAAVENFTRELPALIAKHYNHPSVIVYTLMNESWGVNEIYKHPAQQAFVNGAYWMTKALDPSRLVVGNDGWEQTTTDLLTVHDYNADPKTLKESYANMEQAVNGCPSRTSLRHTYAKGYAYAGQPFMISEFGGVAFDTGTYAGKESWGYGKRLEGQEAVLHKIRDLTRAVMELPGMCGYCYTQLTDVEQEVNGLLDHNHEHKFDPATLREIFNGGSHTGFLFV